VEYHYKTTTRFTLCYVSRRLSRTYDSSGLPSGGIVLDPFFGSGTTGVVALKHRRRFVGMELNQAYIDYANERLSKYLKQKKLV
jgi:DNA modification methylase